MNDLLLCQKWGPASKFPENSRGITVALIDNSAARLFKRPSSCTLIKGILGLSRNFFPITVYRICHNMLLKRIDTPHDLL